MQPAVDQIVEMCLANNLATRRNIQLRNTGIHPENRAKTGVDPLNAQALALKISLQGYSEAKLENPMGFEKATPGTPAASAQEKFMENNFKLASGYLNPIPWHDTEYLPVTCSHTAAAANIVRGGKSIKCVYEKMSTGGYLDPAKTMQLCPSWQKPLTDGIPCIVFRKELDAECPELAEFLSKAGN